MKKITLLFFALVVSLMVSAQSFDVLMLKGQTKMNEEQYEDAKEFFIKAKEVATTKSEKASAESLIAKCQSIIKAIADKKIEEQKQAEAERRAEASRREAARKAHENAKNNRKVSKASIPEVAFSHYLVCNYDKNDELLGASFQEPLKADEVCWLSPWVIYKSTSSEAISATLNMKFFMPNGRMEIFKDAKPPIGYTYSKDFNLEPGTDKSICLFTWGDDKPGTFEPGKYRLELWYDGGLLFADEFELE